MEQSSGRAVSRLETRRICSALVIVALFVIGRSAVSAADLRILTWNIESGGNSPIPRYA